MSTQRDREMSELHFKVGDRVAWGDLATCFEMPGDQGTVVFAQQGGPYLSARYEVCWDRTGRTYGYGNGHLDLLKPLTAPSETPPA